MSLIVKGETRSQTGGGLGFVAGIFVLGLILIYFLEEQRNREKYENEQSDIRRGLRDSVLTSGDNAMIITSKTGD